MRKKIILIGAIALIISAILITTTLIQQQQDNRQRASGNETPTSTSTATPTEITLDSEEWKFLELINQYRASLNRTPLKVSKTLTAAAKWKSNDSFSTNTLDHVDSLGRNIERRIPAFGYTSQPIGENIAMVFQSAQSAFDGFYNACDDFGNGCTYAHRKNMENAQWRAIGIGRHIAKNNQNWYWTTDFGGSIDQEIIPTSAPTLTDSPTATNTPSPTATPTPTSPDNSDPTPSDTPTPTSTSTPTSTPTVTEEPAISATPTIQPTTSQPTITSDPIQSTPTPTTIPATAPSIEQPGGSIISMGVIGGAFLVILGGLFLILL